MPKSPKTINEQKKKNIVPKNASIQKSASEHEDDNLRSTSDNSMRLNWDVIGLSATAITLGGAAIFFVSGWYYEARWYSFYGIDISQLSLSPINFMVQGIPGILFFLISLSTSWILIKISKGLFQTFWAHKIEGNSLEVELINTILKSELVWTGLLAFFFLSIFAVIGELAFMVIFPYTYQPSYVILLGGIVSFVTVLSIALGLGSLRSELFYFRAAFALIEVYLRERFTKLQSALIGTIGIITVIFIALTFMISISISGIRGQFDAISHTRSLSGWFVPKTIVLSEKKIPVLSEYLVASNDEDLYRYGPFGLVASDEYKYYLVKFEENRYLTQPMVYTINKQNVELAFIVKGATFLIDLDDIKPLFPTKTPMPTSTPTSTIVVTPTP